MSLLNDMLRDLAHKHQAGDGGEGYDQSLLQSSSLSRKPQGIALKIALVFVLVFALVSGVNYLWHVTKKIVPAQKELVQIRSALVSTSASSASANLVSQHTIEVMLPAASAISSSAAMKDTTSAELDMRIADLLQQAERAMGSERLTAPIEDNAYSYFQKVLVLAPGNEQAKQGLQRIASFFVLKAQEQSQLGNVQQAEIFLQRAKFISPDYFVGSAALNVPVPPKMHDLEPVVEPPTNSQAPAYVPETKVAELPIKSEKVKTLVVAEAGKLEVKPNANSQDEQAVQQANNLVRQGRDVEAINTLKNIIATGTAPARSATLLAEMYLEQGNTQAAEILLAHIDYLPALTTTRLKAQILAAQGNYSGAALLLEQNVAAAESDEGYRALLASMYHKSANYAQSLVTYQRLIQNFGDKPAYWLGLALAYDGLAQSTNALQAYIRARDFPQLQAQVKTYIDQRIAALQSVR